MFHTTPSDERAGTVAGPHAVSRRTVARGMAWTAPIAVVGIAVPAFAASGAGGGCVQVPLTFSFTSGDPAHVSKLMDGLTKVADIAYAASRASGNNDPYYGNQTAWSWQTPDPGWDAIRLHHPKGMQTDDTLTMTISFLQAAKGLTLTISDIDQDTESWIDHVVVTPVGYTILEPAGGIVTGSGTTLSPFRSSTDEGIADHSGDVTLTWPGLVSAVTITYTAADLTNKSDIGQMIQIGQFGYDPC